MSKKILIIEDDAALQKALTDTLTERGYAIVSAFDGEDGVAQANREHPDLILLDIILPKKDGFSVLHEVKSNPAIAATPVIVLTNLEDSADIERLLELGATTFLTKTSYRLEDIAKKIQETLTVL